MRLNLCQTPAVAVFASVLLAPSPVALPSAPVAPRSASVAPRSASVAPRSAFVALPSAFVAPAVVSPAGFRWPVDGPRVVRPFDPPAHPWLAGHRGVDVATHPGAVVHAAGRGTVLYAGRIAGRGVVSVQHPGGLRTTYEPLDVDARLRSGDRVTATTRLGILAAGHRGCPAEACLHWGLRRGEQYLDPLSLLGLGRVRLLPL